MRLPRLYVPAESTFMSHHVTLIVVHAARSPTACLKARFFGPACIVPGLARPGKACRVWAASPARRAARPGTREAGRPVGGPQPRPIKHHIPPSASPLLSSVILHDSTQRLRTSPPSTPPPTPPSLHPLLQAPPSRLRRRHAAPRLSRSRLARSGAPFPADRLPLHHLTEPPPPSILPPSPRIRRPRHRPLSLAEQQIRPGEQQIRGGKRGWGPGADGAPAAGGCGG